MNRIIIVLVLCLAFFVGGGFGGYFFAAGRCATKENNAMSDAIGDSNDKSVDIIEHATEVDKEEDETVEKIIEVKYLPAPAGSCPLPNITQHMRDVYEASAEADIQ